MGPLVRLGCKVHWTGVLCPGVESTRTFVLERVSVRDSRPGLLFGGEGRWGDLPAEDGVGINVIFGLGRYRLLTRENFINLGRSVTGGSVVIVP